MRVLLAAVLGFMTTMGGAMGTSLVDPELPVSPAPGDPTDLAAALAPYLPADADAAFARALREQERVRALGERAVNDPGLVALLDLAVAQRELVPTETPLVPQYASLGLALEALAAAADVPATADLAARLAAFEAQAPASLERALTDLVAAMVVATALSAEALAGLSPGETDLVVRSLRAMAHDDAAPSPALLAAAAKVDFPLLVAAARVTLEAVETAMPLLAEAGRQLPALPAPVTPASTDVPCGGFLPPLFPGDPLLVVGSPTAGECFDRNTLLLVDLGGNDLYTNNAGGNFGVGPLAVAIDVEGNDLYHSEPVPGTVSADPDQYDFGIEGAGVMGIGVLVDALGNDAYNSGKRLDTAPNGCPSPAGATAGYTIAFAQGSGSFGIGVLADLSGGDEYNSHNELHQCRSNPQDDLNFTVANSQGAGIVQGMGILLDAGRSADLYNSHNRLVSHEQDVDERVNPNAGNNVFIARQVQGAGTHEGIGLLVDAFGDDDYNSHNFLDAMPNPDTVDDGEPPQSTSLFTVKCAQGAGGTCGGAPNRESPFGSQDLANLSRGMGILVDGDGNDDYNCHNELHGSKAQHSQHTNLSAIFVQGAGAGQFGLGAFAELLGNDCYNSHNHIHCPIPLYTVFGAQGVGVGLESLDPAGEEPPLGLSVSGIMVDVAGDDLYNSDNHIEGVNVGDTVRSRTDWTIRFVQGAASGPATLGVHADLGSEFRDRYNSHNLALSESGLGSGRIDVAQGAAGSFGLIPAIFPEFGGLPGGLGVHIDADPLSLIDDEYNSRNAGNTTLFVRNALGVAWIGDGVGIHADAGYNDTYNSFNRFPSGGLSNNHAVANFPGSLGVFADVSLPLFPADIYETGNAWGGPSFNSNCVGSGAVFVDVLDGVEAPVASPAVLAPGLLCLDL